MFMQELGRSPQLFQSFVMTLKWNILEFVIVWRHYADAALLYVYMADILPQGANLAGTRFYCGFVLKPCKSQSVRFRRHRAGSSSLFGRRSPSFLSLHRIYNAKNPILAYRVSFVTGTKGLEPSTSGSTGRRSNQTELRPLVRKWVVQGSNL